MAKCTCGGKICPTCGRCRRPNVGCSAVKCPDAEKPDCFGTRSDQCGTCLWLESCLERLRYNIKYGGSHRES